MTPADVALVKWSFDQVKPIASDATALFYGSLFEIAPAYTTLSGFMIGEAHGPTAAAE